MAVDFSVQRPRSVLRRGSLYERRCDCLFRSSPDRSEVTRFRNSGSRPPGNVEHRNHSRRRDRGQSVRTSSPASRLLHILRKHGTSKSAGNRDRQEDSERSRRRIREQTSIRWSTASPEAHRRMGCRFHALSIRPRRRRCFRAGTVEPSSFSITA